MLITDKLGICPLHLGRNIQTSKNKKKKTSYTTSLLYHLMKTSKKRSKRRYEKVVMRPSLQSTTDIFVAMRVLV